MVSKSQARAQLNSSLPCLTNDNFDLTSPLDNTYNCIAWAAGDSSRWWWPGSSQTYWPKPGVRLELAAFRDAFNDLGYLETTNCGSPENFERVAIYEKDGKPTHAARQLEDGKWTSKLGTAWDISHDLDALNGGEYGQPALIMERPRKTL